jgi:O-antigen/teichoic acid export membrane protein
VKPRGIAANSALALSADLAGKASTVAVTVVAARTLATRDFALFATCLAAASLLTSGLDAGAQTLLTRDGVAGSDRRGSLFRALAIGRLPLAALSLVLSMAVGFTLGRPLEALLAFVFAIVLAAGLSLSGLLRSTQDLRPEAEWKLLTGILSVGLVLPAAIYSNSPLTLLAALTVASALGLWPLLRASRPAGSFVPGVRPVGAMRSAIPLGLLGLATVVYYRSGVIALSLLGSSKDTAMYAVAANVAFGLLTVPNAVTTGLLPRLASESSDRARITVARRALWWTALLSGLLVTGAALLGPRLLTLVFGQRYAAAAEPLVLLTVGVLVISVSGVLGTFLVATRTLRPLGVQVAISLAVNLAALAVLVPALGANGAALATVACEVAGLSFLTAVAWRLLPALVQLPATPAPGRTRAEGMPTRGSHSPLDQPSL